MHFLRSMGAAASLALTALVVLACGDTSGGCETNCGGQLQETVVVTQADLVDTPDTSHWYFYNDTDDSVDNALGSFVVGAATPPAGTGSVAISVVGDPQRSNLATSQFGAVLLADITQLAFSTYNASASNAGSSNRSAFLVFNVDFDGSNTWQRRLVYVPGSNGVVLPDTWQEWDAINSGNALWSWSGGSNWPDGVIAANRTWDDIVASFPLAKMWEDGAWLGLRVGEPYNSAYTENLDLFKFGTADKLTSFDFEN